MSVIAGIDIGNSTTEIVIADCSSGMPMPIAAERGRTRGAKGSDDSIKAAARLLMRMQRIHNVHVDQVVLTPQTPVTTFNASLPAPLVDTGPLTLVAAGASTPAGGGAGVGVPVAIGQDPPRHGAVIAVATDPLGYVHTAAVLNTWLKSGICVLGVLMAGDEARLVSRRIDRPLPIIDAVATEAVLACDLVAMEVAADARLARFINDPMWLVAHLGLQSTDHDFAARVSRLTEGLPCAAVGLSQHRHSPASRVSRASLVEFADGRRRDLWECADELSTSPPGTIAGLLLPDRDIKCSDTWLVDLQDLGGAAIRQGARTERPITLATLDAHDVIDPVRRFQQWWDGSVSLIASEPLAAFHGAITTPGTAEHALVLDLGGGTIDVITPDGTTCTGAGSGELVTTATAQLLDISSGMAEWVKRGPAFRIDAPSVLVDEDGTRRFAETAQRAVGWLAVPGPAGDLPFSRTIASGEWRSLRLSLKERVFGSNAARLAAHVHTGDSSDVVVVGGPAADSELFDAVRSQLPWARLGRANVAATLGHRYAVAFGLCRLACAGLSPDIGAGIHV